MFAWWGRTVYRYRFIVIGVTVALCLGGGVFGISLGKHVTQSGFYDDGSQSVKASVLGDNVYGRDRTSHIVATFTAPRRQDRQRPGLVEDRSTTNSTNSKPTTPTRCSAGSAICGPRSPPTRWSRAWRPRTRSTPSCRIPLKGDSDDSILNNYKAIAPDLQKLEGGKVEVAGLEPVANGLTGTIDNRPTAHGSSGAAAGGGGVVPGVRRGDRRLPAGDGRRPGHRRRAGHHAIHRDVQPGELLRPARGDHDRSRYRGRLRAVRGEPVPGGDRRGLRQRGRGSPHDDDGRTHGDVLGGADRGFRGQHAGVPAGLPEVADLRRHRGGHAVRDLVDHASCRRCWESWATTSTRLGVRTLLRVPFLAQLEAVAGLPELARRPAAEDQDPRRGRAGVLGQAGQPGDEAPAAVRHPDRGRR